MDSPRQVLAARRTRTGRPRSTSPAVPAHKRLREVSRTFHLSLEDQVDIAELVARRLPEEGLANGPQHGEEKGRQETDDDGRENGGEKSALRNAHEAQEREGRGHHAELLCVFEVHFVPPQLLHEEEKQDESEEEPSGAEQQGKHQVAPEIGLVARCEERLTHEAGKVARLQLNRVLVKQAGKPLDRLLPTEVEGLAPLVLARPCGYQGELPHVHAQNAQELFGCFQGLLGIELSGRRVLLGRDAQGQDLAAAGHLCFERGSRLFEWIEAMKATGRINLVLPALYRHLFFGPVSRRAEAEELLHALKALRIGLLGEGHIERSGVVEKPLGGGQNLRPYGGFIEPGQADGRVDLRIHQVGVRDGTKNSGDRKQDGRDSTLAHSIQNKTEGFGLQRRGSRGWNHLHRGPLLKIAVSVDNGHGIT